MDGSASRGRSGISSGTGARAAKSPAQVSGARADRLIERLLPRAGPRPAPGRRLPRALPGGERQPDRAAQPNRRVVVGRGSVVDVRFDERLPPIYSVLRAGEDGAVVIEVLSQRDAHHVRGIALTPTQGLARGMAVEDTGGPLKAPVGKAILSRMFDVFGHTIDRRPAAGRCPVALGASRAAAARAALHQVGDLRDRASR